ncbi:HemX protein [Testudinibacter sp. TR-2022]|uniref:uroporphyrinogen-III C-methyltransferase n=1 Tax=Testudinibacter sp. TR-2022 TaxID=2585029 RepID=UPI001118C7AA|nr:uroporphyrinogen-III C-methyltransferase [Testudinibacter sp. TR-2022]TNH05091.1 HemX protein [Pasteurellaceae bacterium Phil31]TNH08965.1 HemX protein [Testudinibacter sp. TR-2022]TNH10642.1 HemX protein [Testudinibacter sp. TR-2022]TNH17184.1 HemX protein [Testudinibacter sp. TR-2022]TNH20746.1 HemX protein [Testudinibacter sp. TR-2022]
MSEKNIKTPGNPAAQPEQKTVGDNTAPAIENTVASTKGDPSAVTPSSLAQDSTSKGTAGNKKSSDKKTSAATPETTMNSQEKNPTKTPTSTTKKSGGTGFSLLAILIALGIGGVGYYWGNQQLDTLRNQVTALSAQLQQLQSQPVATASSSTPEAALSELNATINAQLNALQNQQESAQQQTQNDIKQLISDLNLQKAENSELRNQLNKLTFDNKAEPNDWLMSEADFLLTNAQRKLVLDNDIDTVVSLLQEANQTLQKVSGSQAVAVRTAISHDLNQLQNLNEVDQDLIMSQLSLLVSQVDNLKVLALNPNRSNNSEVSDSINDWQSNLEKSASSFLDHFIRISKKEEDRPELLAPNQDIYLRENIRLSLLTALSAVPRQQNEVYKQSLNSVATWLRSYFDTDDFSVQQFLQQVDQLKEQSIYIDAPQQLNSWQAIGTLLNRDHRTLERISNDAAAISNRTNTEDTGNTTEKPVVTETAEPTTTPTAAPEAQTAPAADAATDAGKDPAAESAQ